MFVATVRETRDTALYSLFSKSSHILTKLLCQVAVPSSTVRHVILSDEETTAILQSAEECVASECTVDDVSMLISELKMQEGVLSDRLVKIMNMIAHLQHVNEKQSRKTDEVRQFVKDMLRVFNHDSPNYFPTGWAGDVGDGPTTAYDALEPKKWKPADKK